MMSLKDVLCHQAELALFERNAKGKMASPEEILLLRPQDRLCSSCDRAGSGEIGLQVQAQAKTKTSCRTTDKEHQFHT